VTHPAQYSAAVLERFEVLLGGIPAVNQPLVFDPFAGPGTRLGRLCDKLDMRFAGIDIEDWPGHDSRVRQANAVDLSSYPLVPFVVVTSPTYPNGMSDHFLPRDASQRYTYRTAIGHELDQDNSGRYSIRGGNKALDLYWAIVKSAVQCWADRKARALVNVKDFVHDGDMYPLADEWEALMISCGYTLAHRLEARVPGMRNGRNREARQEYEAILVCRI